MYTANQSINPATSPVLRTARRQRQPAGPAPAAQFEWYFCSPAGTVSHLVLLAGQQPLGHWVLPALGGGAAEPSTGLWLQVAPGLGLARPGANGPGGRGTALGRNAAGTAPAVAILAPAGLVLHLPATNGLHHLYWLRPGSASWLLSRGRPHSEPY
jgi:hypothetical protein